MEQKIFTRKQTAEFLNVSLGTLGNWETAGLLTPSRIGRRVYYTEIQIHNALNKQG